MGTTAQHFTIGLLIVAGFVLAIMLAQGIGEQLGGGFREYLVR